VGCAVLVVAAGTSATAATAGRRAASGALDLHAELLVKSLRFGACPAGTPVEIECHPRSGSGRVPGLGDVTVAYLFETDAQTCGGGDIRVPGYTVVLTVRGKGELELTLDEATGCLGEAAARSPTQTYTVTGGTGVYAGASGAGRVDRTLHQTEQGAAGTETFTGSLSVPGLEFDLTPPQLTGARARTVRAARHARRARVTYRVAATDAADGPVAVVCRPASGSRFPVGRTLVRCSATDGSGNTAKAAFRVTVRARR
jgi:hypothetical protein